MNRVRLGRTNLEVGVASLGTGGRSRLGLGTGGSVDNAIALVHAALDAGVTLIDTAAAYDNEEVVGAAIKGRRDEVVISTKVRVDRQSPPTMAGEVVTPAEFAAGAEASLRRLGVDCIDILHIHGVLPGRYDYCVEQLLPVLARLREQGKIRFTAISEHFGLDPAHDLLQRAVLDEFFDVMMVGLNLVNASAAVSVLPEARRRDIGTQIIYAVRGKLATRAGAATLVAEAIARGEVAPADIDAADPLGFVVSPGSSLTDAAYRFARHTPGVDVVVTGTGNLAHLAENLASIDGPPLPAPTLAHLQRVFGRVRSVSGD